MTRSEARAVVLVSNSDTFGGAEVYLERLMRARRPPLAITLAARSSSPPRLLDAAAAAHVPVTEWRPAPIGLWRLLRAMAEARVVHLNMAWAGDNAHALALAWLIRTPVVATVHIWVPPGSELRRRVLRLAYRRFQRVLAVSSDIAEMLLSELGVAPGAVEVVVNGVPVTGRVSRQPRRVVVVGGLGRLVPAKGFDLLVEAVRRLLERGHPVEAVVAGDGPERQRLEAAAQGLPVRFVGFQDDPAAFLASIDIFCLPSRSEGLPLALLEAMMAGTACVGADVGGVAAALEGVGAVVPADDVDALTAALAELVTSPQLRSELAEAAHRRARHRFRLETSLARTTAVYDEVEAVTRWRGRRSRVARGG